MGSDPFAPFVTSFVSFVMNHGWPGLGRGGDPVNPAFPGAG